MATMTSPRRFSLPNLHKINYYKKPNFGIIKVETFLKGSLDSIPSPSPSVKIQIMGKKVCLRCKGKTLLGVVNKLLKGEGDGIESRLSS